MIFKEDHIAEIKVKKILLSALQGSIKELQPMLDRMTLEASMLTDDIKRLEKELEEDKS